MTGNARLRDQEEKKIVRICMSFKLQGVGTYVFGPRFFSGNKKWEAVQKSSNSSIIYVTGVVSPGKIPYGRLHLLLLL